MFKVGGCFIKLRESACFIVPSPHNPPHTPTAVAGPIPCPSHNHIDYTSSFASGC